MMFETVNWQRISGSGWPIWQILVYYSDINKGEFLFSPDRKYTRKFLDLDLRDSEIVLYEFNRNQFTDLAALKNAASLGVWGGHVRRILLRKLSDENFQLRPIFVSVLNAIGIAMGFEKLFESPNQSHDGKIPLTCGSFFNNHYRAAKTELLSFQNAPGTEQMREWFSEKVTAYEKLIQASLFSRDHVRNASVNLTDAVLEQYQPALDYLFQTEYGVECASSGIGDEECVSDLGCCVAAQDPRTDGGQDPVRSGGTLNANQAVDQQPNQSKRNWNSEEARFVERDAEEDPALEEGRWVRRGMLKQPR